MPDYRLAHPGFYFFLQVVSGVWNHQAQKGETMSLKWILALVTAVLVALAALPVHTIAAQGELTPTPTVTPAPTPPPLAGMAGGFSRSGFYDLFCRDILSEFPSESVTAWVSADGGWIQCRHGDPDDEPVFDVSFYWEWARDKARDSGGTVPPPDPRLNLVAGLALALLVALVIGLGSVMRRRTA